jgi:ribosomal protein S12 methylthiotransferase accessory factor YcaO
MVDRRDNLGTYKGYGSNLNSDLAVQRCICEAAQGRAVFLSGGRDDMRWLEHMYESKQFSNEALLAGLKAEEKHPYTYVAYEPMSESDSISFIEDMLIEHGCGKIIVFDVWHNKNAYVVKVMSEHLEGYWNRFLQLGRRAS